MITLNYSANNSGGGWWLTDENWHDLEKAGWAVEWVKDDPFLSKMGVKDGRWLGTLARSASKKFETPEAGVAEWTKITEQDPWAEGCNRCGVPHNFSYEKSGKKRFITIEKL